MNVKDVLSTEELKSVTARSNWKAAWLFIVNYALTFAIFAMMAIWPNPLTIVLAIILFGGRQLGFGVLVHECGHGTLFTTKKLNDFFGTWFAAPPTFNNMHAYARGHLAHHRLAGTHEDPDLPNYDNYPIEPARFRRKVWRDLSGRTGWKQTKGLYRALLKVASLPAEARDALLKGLVAQVLILAACTAAGAPWMFIVWWVAFMTTHRLILRIRQVAEHGAVEGLYDPDPRLNTRTVPANWLDRLVFCPLWVCYHLEHHMMASVPAYNLRRMHRMLKAKGHYDEVDFPANYVQLLRHVTTPKPAVQPVVRNIEPGQEPSNFSSW